MTYQALLAAERDSEVQRIAAALQRNVAHVAHYHGRVGVAVIDQHGRAVRALLGIADAQMLALELVRETTVAQCYEDTPATLRCPAGEP